MKKEITRLLAKRSPEWRFGESVYDTFSALSIIARYDKKILEGEPMAKILTLLFSVESNPGGPYYSVFPDDTVPSKTFAKTFNTETNESIARFLALYDIELPNLTAFVGRSFLTGEIKKRDMLSVPTGEKEFFRALRVAIKKRLGSVDPGTRTLALEVVEKTIKGNPDKQMSLMAYYTALAIGKKNKEPTKLLIDMAVANIFFWTAFIIYDDFWDEDEAQDARLLPVANLFARSYTEFFSTLLPSKTKFSKFFHTLMDELDAANVWETSQCRAERTGSLFMVPKRLPSYKQYVNKYRAASGHVLGSVALLCMQGYKIDSAEVRRFVSYFEHYLIAMQLNDDMHDWEEDLERGHISTAIDMLLRDYGKVGEIDLEKEIDELRRVFWFVSLPKLAKKAVEHSDLALEALHAMKSIVDPKPLLVFAENPKSVAVEALQNHKNSVDFLKTFTA